MDSLQIKREKPIPAKCGCGYKGLAFDGCYFYVTCPSSCEITKYDKTLCETGCFPTQRPYTCICYDPREPCFWAAANDCCYTLFKLDSCFREIDSLAVRVCDEGGAMITGVSYDCLDNRLLVSFPSCVVTIDKTVCGAYHVLQRASRAWNMGVLALAPSYLVTTQDCRQSVDFYDACGVLKHRCTVPKHYMIESILSYPCADKTMQRYHLCVLATKNGYYPYLLEWIIDPYALELPICRCNLPVCSRPCGEKPCSEEACSDLIESVALIEAALSHVLNAEGEKLQKVIACTDDADKILCVNQSINDTIVNVAHLEIILHDKLAKLKQVCPACEDGCGGDSCGGDSCGGDSCGGGFCGGDSCGGGSCAAW